jgi:pimeloyl-ACP methyl ester carboxylesterase
MDLRGHGGSEVSADGYDDPGVWAADLAAVLELAGRPAVLVGSSYGGLVITDYLRAHGQAGVAGLVLAGASPRSAPDIPAARSARCSPTASGTTCPRTRPSRCRR